MKHRLSTRLLALGLALGTIAGAAALVAPANGATTAKGTVVALKKTSLGTILVDARGRTLYLFEKDRSGVSACAAACAKFWPRLTSQATPRAGKGVQQSMLRLTRQHNGLRQVTYAGHPLYTFVGDKSSGQTAGEGLNNFGAEWYVLAASGQKVEPSPTSAGGYGSSGGGYGSGGGW
jgi:predicted lipoprotein with Yx(FWY)xxD motif